MKNQIIITIIILTGGPLLPLITQAQGMAYIYNLGQPSINSASIGSDSWLAAGFSTGTNAGGYWFNSIQLGMAAASGNSIGFTVMLYSSSARGEPSPGSSLDTLNGSLSPVTDGTFAYASASSLILSPDTAYFIVVTAGTTIADGAYEWSNAGASTSYNPSGGWAAPLSVGAIDNYQSSNGSSWGFAHTFPEFAINATAVPEPGTYALFVVGCACFFGLRKHVI